MEYFSDLRRGLDRSEMGSDSCCFVVSGGGRVLAHPDEQFEYPAPSSDLSRLPLVESTRSLIGTLAHRRIRGPAAESISPPDRAGPFYFERVPTTNWTVVLETFQSSELEVCAARSPFALSRLGTPESVIDPDSRAIRSRLVLALIVLLEVARFSLDGRRPLMIYAFTNPSPCALLMRRLSMAAMLCTLLFGRSVCGEDGSGLRLLPAVTDESVESELPETSADAVEELPAGAEELAPEVQIDSIWEDPFSWENWLLPSHWKSPDGWENSFEVGVDGSNGNSTTLTLRTAPT